MNKAEEHRVWHVKLHRALDDLLANYMEHHPNEKQVGKILVMDVMRWAHLQTIKSE